MTTTEWVYLVSLFVFLVGFLGFFVAREWFWRRRAIRSFDVMVEYILSTIDWDNFTGEITTAKIMANAITTAKIAVDDLGH